MYLECTCADINQNTWNRLMKGARKKSYRILLKLIKKQLPELYRDLALEFPNPWDDQTKQTDTHYILVHSATEYFINKNH